MTVEEMEKYAKENHIPIMLKEGIDFLCNLIKEKKIKTILEVGSAIGYSSIRMALVDKNIHITTIEKDEERYLIAEDNIKYNHLENQITLIHDDALNTKINQKYDLIFIDASKGNNTNFFNKYSANLAECGIIVTDNLSFHGLVEDQSLIKTKNQQKLVNKIKDYINFLENNQEFETTYVSVGDKISISKKKVD